MRAPDPSRRRLTALVLSAPALLLLLVFFAGPFVFLLRLGLSSPATGSGFYQAGTWTTENYTAFFADAYARQVIKRSRGRRVVEVTRRLARGSAEAIAAVLARTGTGTGINTAYIERLNATFRGHWTPLVRRGRALMRERCVEAGMWLVGCVSNFCWEHASLRVRVPAGSGPQWQGRTPAMVAGLTDPAGPCGRWWGNGCRRRAGSGRVASHDGDGARAQPWPRAWQRDHGCLWCYR